MRKLLTFTLLLLFFQIPSFGKKLQPLFNYAVFQTATGNAYLETYIQIMGPSVRYQPVEGGKYQGSVSVTMTIKRGDSVFYADRILLKSPVISDTTSEAVNFFHQDRISLANGKYELYVAMSDAETPTKIFDIPVPLLIDQNREELSISDINVLDGYQKTTEPNIMTKGGYDLYVNVPYGEYFCPQNVDKLTFYAEIYNVDEALNDAALLQYYLESSKTKFMVESSKRVQKLKPKAVQPLLANMPIADLPSGEFNLVLEVYNRANELMTQKKMLFVRENPVAQVELASAAMLDTRGTFVEQYTDIQQLDYYIRSLGPISEPSDLRAGKTVLENQELDEMQRYLLGFWMNEDYYEAEEAWQKYLVEVRAAEEMFGSRQKPGFATERGRVFLRYGRPANVESADFEPSAYPYQIWQYYTAKRSSQSNLIFVFVNEAIALDEYILIHSTARGEPYNEQWRARVTRRNNPTSDFDQQGGVEHFGSSIFDGNIINGEGGSGRLNGPE